MRSKDNPRAKGLSHFIFGITQGAMSPGGIGERECLKSIEEVLVDAFEQERMSVRGTEPSVEDEVSEIIKQEFGARGSLSGEEYTRRCAREVIKFLRGRLRDVPLRLDKSDWECIERCVFGERK